jgi:hypothetical protein
MLSPLILWNCCNSWSKPQLWTCILILMKIGWHWWKGEEIICHKIFLWIDLSVV